MALCRACAWQTFTLPDLVKDFPLEIGVGCKPESKQQQDHSDTHLAGPWQGPALATP